ncbi:MAG: TIGR01458 family HAD-type hydrolase [Solirubrobacterales bacterium]
MPGLPADPAAFLLDIDGVLHVGREPTAGAVEALERLREIAPVRLLTNTTSRARASIVAELRAQGFAVGDEEVLTPAALTVAHCRERGYRRVSLLVSEDLRSDLADLEEVSGGERADAVVLGDLGDRLTPALMNEAFNRLLGGAALIALQHNRYWRSEEGLVLDVGAWAAALEYGAGVESVVIGKPSAEFFAAALEDVAVAAGSALMVGDDVEADVGGGLAAGIASVLVRTGKFSDAALAASGIDPTAVIDRLAELPDLFRG